MNDKYLSQFIIVPVLSSLQIYNEFAKDLMLYTIKQENKEGFNLLNLTKNGFGIYALSGIAHTKVWYDFIRKEHPMIVKLSQKYAAPKEQPNERLVYDLNYATAMMGLHYHYSKAFKHRDSYNEVDLYQAYFKHHPNPNRCLNMEEQVVVELPVDNYTSPNNPELIEELKKSESEKLVKTKTKPTAR